jgi:hypothetical protein
MRKAQRPDPGFNHLVSDGFRFHLNFSPGIGRDMPPLISGKVRGEEKQNLICNSPVKFFMASFLLYLDTGSNETVIVTPCGKYRVMTRVDCLFPGNGIHRVHNNLINIYYL